MDEDGRGLRAQSEANGDGQRPAFGINREESSRRWLWLVLGLAFFAVCGVGLFLLQGSAGRSATAVNQVFPKDPYAPDLTLSEIAMSQSTSIAGGTSTFIDGVVRNTGERTVTAITVQVLFGNDEGMPPEVETLPMMLIRTHQPYVDTVALSAAPLRPQGQAEFRLIFEKLPSNWNQQTPEIRVVKVKSEAH